MDEEKCIEEQEGVVVEVVPSESNPRVNDHVASFRVLKGKQIENLLLTISDHYGEGGVVIVCTDGTRLLIEFQAEECFDFTVDYTLEKESGN